MSTDSFIFEIYNELPRQGPGSNESTRYAFAILKNRSPKLKILDIGCGTGMQTIELAKISNGTIIALDIHLAYLEELKKQAKEQDIADSTQTILESMFSMEFKEKSFDVIWAEGSAYILGFEKALKEWRFFLRKPGYLAVSELVWLKDNVPNEAKEFFELEYSAMKNYAENVKIIERLGYELMDSFVLPESDWWDYFYAPLEKRIAILREKYIRNVQKIKELDVAQKEVDIFRKYSEYYGYAFYVMKARF
jgi:ubiquinone/menaquinone biosynthesis C-methylase UbiE